jgi:hypothetical protein
MAPHPSIGESITSSRNGTLTPITALKMNSCTGFGNGVMQLPEVWYQFAGNGVVTVETVRPTIYKLKSAF